MVVIHLAQPFRNHLDLSIIMFDESNLVFIKLVFACVATYVRRSKFLCIKNILQTFSRILLSRGCFLVSFFQLTLADWINGEVLPVRLLWPLIELLLLSPNWIEDLLFYEGLPPNPLLISHSKHQVQIGIMCCLNNFLICQLVQINAHHWYDGCCTTNKWK